jgi:hypothetical protein
VTLPGRWHNADLSGGFTLIECSDPVAYTDAAQWTDLMDISRVPVLAGGEVGPVLAARLWSGDGADFSGLIQRQRVHGDLVRFADSPELGA